MLNRRQAALRLDIPLEMARRHGIPSWVPEDEIDRLEADPPAWLLQSRAARKPGGKPVWVELRCEVCGFTEAARPKKWWPDYTYLSCMHHGSDELPEPAAGLRRREVDGIGSRFIGIVDEAPAV
ncbi:hypothetical protein ACL9RL_10065 [Plantibacter sp. Mn2098]|uniref:hypothetical protein n=1 Tax=Plantibacter sp. Mn2098 TaxID=3395266 RepID=UPI003BCE2F69